MHQCKTCSSVKCVPTTIYICRRLRKAISPFVLWTEGACDKMCPRKVTEEEFNKILMIEEIDCHDGRLTPLFKLSDAKNPLKNYIQEALTAASEEYEKLCGWTGERIGGFGRLASKFDLEQVRKWAFKIFTGQDEYFDKVPKIEGNVVFKRSCINKNR